jgi:hypothetical protein
MSARPSSTMSPARAQTPPPPFNSATPREPKPLAHAFPLYKYPLTSLLSTKPHSEIAFILPESRSRTSPALRAPATPPHAAATQSTTPPPPLSSPPSAASCHHLQKPPEPLHRRSHSKPTRLAGTLAGRR